MAYEIHFRSYVFDYAVIDGQQPPQALHAVDLIGDQLQSDTLSFGVIATGEDRGDFFLTSEGLRLVTSDGDYFMLGNMYHGAIDGADLIDYEYGEIVTVYDAGGSLVSKWYLEKVERVSKYVYKFSCISEIGLLIGQTHYGDVYNGTLASTVIAEIMGSLPYTIADDVQGERLYGRLPIASSRDNLHAILFILGASILKDANGDMLIDYLDTLQTQIPDARIYEGGSVEYQTPATDVTVVEHGFYALQTDILETLFDNTGALAPVTSQMVIFQEPCHDLAVTGSLVIEESNANYAVVSGIGILTGLIYSHTTHEYTMATGATGEKNEIRIEDATLINATNSYYIAERVKNYYLANEAKISIVKNTETAGSSIAFTDAFGDAAAGFIREATETYSQIVKADLVVKTDYTPGPFGSNYNSFMILDTAQTWSVPAELAGQHVRVILFGGARGGQAGQKGQNGQSSTYGGIFGDANPKAERSAGGAGGAGGSGFMIFLQDMDLDQASYAIAIGAGGAGGSANGDEGSLGGDTTFGTLSSADGVEATGYYNVIAGEQYGQPGDPGEAGGYGGAATPNAPEAGEDITAGGITYHGGANGGGSYYDGEYTTYAAAGGGAAAGNDGGDAWGTMVDAPDIHPYGGPGGDATIVPAQATGRGQGGHGGNGGGGGGGGGFVFGYTTWTAATNGVGGNGGAGGQGSDGFVLILYNA